MTFDQVINVLSDIALQMVTACSAVESVRDCETGNIIVLNRHMWH